MSINEINNFLAQSKFSFSLYTSDIYLYNSGILNFKTNNGQNYYDIIFKENGLFDIENNLICGQKIYGTNFLSGNFNYGTFDLYLDNNKIFKLAGPTGTVVSGINFSGDLKNNIVFNSFKSPEISTELTESPIYDIVVYNPEYDVDDVDVHFIAGNNLGPIKINSIAYEDSEIGNYRVDSNINFPIYIYPNSQFIFKLINRFKNNNLITIYLTFDSNVGEIRHQAFVIGASSMYSGVQFIPDVSKTSFIDDDSALWSLEVDNLLYGSISSITGNVYAEIKSKNADNTAYVDRFFRNNAIFGITPKYNIPSFNFKKNWSGCFAFNNNDVSLTGIKKYNYESFGNIYSLQAFAWTAPWPDAISLNKNSYAGCVFKISKNNFNINDINLYMYNSNNNSGQLNYYLYKIFVTGKKDGYKNILSGLGWNSGTLSNCCGNSGYPSGFPSGFPFNNQNTYGFYSGFGFGNFSGYLLTGNPLYSGSLNINANKLKPKDPLYSAPLDESNIIKIDTNWLNLSTGFYALLFNSDSTSIEDNMYWPKMWPNDTIVPRSKVSGDSDDFVYFNFNQSDYSNLSNYFYESGFEYSGYRYSGISGIDFITSLKSDSNPLDYYETYYNCALSFNKDPDVDKLSTTFMNSNNNSLKIYFERFLLSDERLFNNFNESCEYKISGNNIFYTGTINIYKNNFRQLQADWL